MDLKLIVDQGQELLGHRAEIAVDADVFSIGRGNDNSWVLPDPKLHISNKHCVIHRKNDEFHLTDISTNGVYLNGHSEPLGRGRSQILRHGDSIIIGEYLINVSLSGINSSFVNNTTPTHEELDSAHPRDEVEDLTADLVASTKNTSSLASTKHVLESVVFETPSAAELTTKDATLDELLDDAVPLPSTEPTISELLRPVAPEKEFYVPPKAVTEKEASHQVEDSPSQKESQTKQAIPANWLDFANESDQSPLASSRVEANTVHSPTNSPALDANDTVHKADALDHIDRSAIQKEMDGNGNPLEKEMPDFEIQERSIASRMEEQIRTATADEKTQSTNAQKVSEQHELFDIMMKEAGISEHLFHGKDKRDIAKLMGRMLRQFAQGTIDTLATRSMVKSEFRLQQTMIRPVDNNPLKLSPSGDEALKIMLMGDSSAYLPAENSIQEGFKDIQAHQLAMMSGIQAAFMHLLQRFEPEMLTQKFEARPRYHKGLLNRNKTDLWREYQDYYHDICAMMEDEFQDLFSNEFGKAYENQLRKIR